MGRVGAAGDNAAMESFFGLLQNNVLDRRTWATREQLRIAIVTWIERTYPRRRRQKSLARLTPIGFPLCQAVVRHPGDRGWLVGRDWRCVREQQQAAARAERVAVGRSGATADPA